MTFNLTFFVAVDFIFLQYYFNILLQAFWLYFMLNTNIVSSNIIEPAVLYVISTRQLEQNHRLH